MIMMAGSHVLDDIIPLHLLDHILIFMDQTLSLQQQHTLIGLIDLLLHQPLKLIHDGHVVGQVCRRKECRWQGGSLVYWQDGEEVNIVSSLEVLQEQDEAVLVIIEVLEGLGGETGAACDILQTMD